MPLAKFPEADTPPPCVPFQSSLPKGFKTIEQPGEWPSSAERRIGDAGRRRSLRGRAARVFPRGLRVRIASLISRAFSSRSAESKDGCRFRIRRARWAAQSKN